MTNDENNKELLPIVIEGITFKPTAEGMWSLNEIHQTLGLPESKRPSEWNNSTSGELRASGNFRKVDKVGSLADELGTIAYAMWVSTAFYLMVVRAFVTMRNDAILSARISSLALTEKEKLLTYNMPKATALMLKAKSHGLSWSDACRAAQVDRPILAKNYLLSQNKFTKVFDYDKGEHVIKPTATAFSSGFFRRHTGKFGNIDGWKVTDKGVIWLENNAKNINEAVRIYQANRKKHIATKSQGRR